MNNEFTLALIDNSFLPNEFATVGMRAEQAGFRVIRYSDSEAFLAASDDHAVIDTLLCMGGTPCDERLIANMPRLRALLSAVTGIEGFDVNAATAQGVFIGNGQTELNYLGMAESTILLMLAALYDLNGTQKVLRESLSRPAPLKGRSLRGLTVGFIGFGRIAQEVATRLAHWGTPMIAYVHRPNPMLDALDVSPVRLDELLERADIVSLHCSLNAETYHILDARRLALMKRDAILINTARGALVDEEALFNALVEERIAGAALDTFEVEPLPTESRLRELSSVILTPHMIGHTAKCNETLCDTAWESICRVARGEPPLFVKNPAAMERWRRRFAYVGAA
ncbi:MAG: NAD(P)-dependent oxidoreductase [Pseudomonadota bacterium]